MVDEYRLLQAEVSALRKIDQRPETIGAALAKGKRYGDVGDIVGEIAYHMYAAVLALSADVSDPQDVLGWALPPVVAERMFADMSADEVATAILGYVCEVHRTKRLKNGSEAALISHLRKLVISVTSYEEAITSEMHAMAEFTHATLRRQDDEQRALAEAAFTAVAMWIDDVLWEFAPHNLQINNRERRARQEVPDRFVLALATFKLACAHGFIPLDIQEKFHAFGKNRPQDSDQHAAQ